MSLLRAPFGPMDPHHKASIERALVAELPQIEDAHIFDGYMGHKWGESWCPGIVFEFVGGKLGNLRGGELYDVEDYRAYARMFAPWVKEMIEKHPELLEEK